jgi:hypothetical protein
MALICYHTFLRFQLESRALDSHPFLETLLMFATPETPNTPNHDANGHFAKGNTAGKGNPYARECAELRRIVLRKMNAENMQKLVDKLYDDAMNGDKAAARLLMQYSLGRPAPYVDPDTMDNHEWQINHQQVVTAEEFAPCLTQMSVKLANILHPQMREVNQEKQGKQLLDGFKRQDEEQARKAQEEARKAAKVILPTPPSLHEKEPVKMAGNKRQPATRHRHQTGSNGDSPSSRDTTTRRDNPPPIVDSSDR